jgi:hypothetical protein
VAAVLRELDFPLPEQRSRLSGDARINLVGPPSRPANGRSIRALRSDRLRLCGTSTSTSNGAPHLLAAVKYTAHNQVLNQSGRT